MRTRRRRRATGRGTKRGICQARRWPVAPRARAAGSPTTATQRTQDVACVEHKTLQPKPLKSRIPVRENGALDRKSASLGRRGVFMWQRRTKKPAYIITFFGCNNSLSARAARRRHRHAAVRREEGPLDLLAAEVRAGVLVEQRSGGVLAAEPLGHLVVLVQLLVVPGLDPQIRRH